MAPSQGRATAREAVENMLCEHSDVVRESVAFMVRELIEAEVSQLVGAELGERSEGRSTYRHGYRRRRWDTRAGTLDVAIPKLRQGSYFPSAGCCASGSPGLPDGLKDTGAVLATPDGRPIAKSGSATPPSAIARRVPSEIRRRRSATRSILDAERPGCTYLLARSPPGWLRAPPHASADADRPNRAGRHAIDLLTRHRV